MPNLEEIGGGAIMVPSSEEYDDEALYGNRREAKRLAELTKQSKCSECVLFGINLFADKKQWTIKNLIGKDKRTKSMTDLMGVDFAYPLQRYCWPHIESGKFPLLCVAPDLTGKTYSHVLYTITKCIIEVPVSKTDELIAASDKTMGSFSIEQQVAQHRDCSEEVLKNAANIDQDDFDWNKLEQGVEDKLKIEDESGVNEIDNENFKSDNSWFANGDNIDLDDFRFHPKYIIISSNQLNVGKIKDSLEELKTAAYENRVGSGTLRHLPPCVRSIIPSHDDQKLATRCNESDILVATPAALIKCLGRKYILFCKTRRVFFDDLDLTLQLHNPDVREFMKHYLRYLIDKGDDADCQLCFFSKKWTDLVKQFVSEMFKQRIIMFSSIIEASLYSMLCFDLEVFESASAKTQIKLIHTLDIESQKGVKIAIICKSNEEAEKLAKSLKIDDYNIKFLSESKTHSDFKARELAPNPIYVLSDSAFEMIVDNLSDITLLIHYSLPDNWIAFDQRFRLMYKHIQAGEKGLNSIIFLRQKTDIEFAKKLYDVVARSESTLGCTKTTLRDYINKHMTFFCWRWATTGVCKLEKFIRNDRFGSYCQNRHTLISTKEEEQILRNKRKWPTQGQFKISITHLVSPSEFYFRFEEHRDIDSIEGSWTKLANTGRSDMAAFQVELDKLKDTPNCSVPLENFKKGKVYGMYAAQEGRVDRITLMEDISRDDIRVQAETRPEVLRHMFLVNQNLYHLRYSEQYSKQYLVRKTDYGVSLDVYLRNIFELPVDLARAEPKCHRGFHIGYKPIGNEPYWTEKAKKLLLEQISAGSISEIHVWLRLSNCNCFWFERITLMRRLINLESDNRLYEIDPYKELLKNNLAEAIKQAPNFCQKSTRVASMQKWLSDKQAARASYAFLNFTGKPVIPVFVLNVNQSDLSLTLRMESNNKMLVKMETELLKLLAEKKLERQEYLAVGVYCLAKINTLDRCRIIEIQDNNKIKVKCLDHGDDIIVDEDQLFKFPDSADLTDYLTYLPFQSISCQLEGLNPKILLDKELRFRLEDEIYDIARDEKDDLKVLICHQAVDRKVLLYRLMGNSKFAYPVVKLLEEKLERNDIFSSEISREVLRLPDEEEEDNEDDNQQVVELEDQGVELKSSSDCTAKLSADYFLHLYIRNIFLTLAKKELDAAIKHESAY